MKFLPKIVLAAALVAVASCASLGQSTDREEDNHHMGKQNQFLRQTNIPSMSGRNCATINLPARVFIQFCGCEDNTCPVCRCNAEDKVTPVPTNPGEEDPEDGDDAMEVAGMGGFLDQEGTTDAPDPDATSTPAETKKVAPATPTETKKVAPATPAETKKVSPATPTETKKVAPATPAETKNVAPASPAGTKKVSPATPTETKKVSPATPTETKKVAPATPAETKKVAPATPTETKKPAPATPAETKNVAPASPAGTNKVAPATPTETKKVAPAPVVVKKPVNEGVGGDNTEAAGNGGAPDGRPAAPASTCTACFCPCTGVSNIGKYHFLIEDQMRRKGIL